MKLLTAILLLFALSAHARMGESKAQLIKRFGKPSSDVGIIKKQGLYNGYYLIFFERNNFSIKCLLKRDKCVMLMVHDVNDGPFDIVDAENILRKNGEFAEIEKKYKSFNAVCKKTRRVATFASDMLTIYDLDFWKIATSDFRKKRTDSF